ncbi:MAG: tetratricopeptide repeat protein [bacterium]
MHIWNFLGPAFLLIPAGFWTDFRHNKARGWVLLLAFFVSGPVFLFMGNMPPNPHALAVVEPHYLLPDLCLAFWAAAGLYYLLEQTGSVAAKKAAVYAACILTLVWTAWKHVPAADRRWNLSAVDFASDSMSSLPPESVLVAKKDVQLFALWHAQLVEGKRPDIKVVAQGLSGTKWYRDAYASVHPDLRLRHLSRDKPREWKAFLESSPVAVFATMDAELPEGMKTVPNGIIRALSAGGGKQKTGMAWDYYSFRGLTDGGTLAVGGGSADAYRYPDFFTRDLASVYSQAAVEEAAYLNARGGRLTPDAVKRLRMAALIDADLPDAPLYLGLDAAGRNDWETAGKYFSRSAVLYEKTVELSEEYHSLPELKDAVLKFAANAWLNLGVSLEKLGRKKEAEKAYDTALLRDPTLAEAHYNLAVLYWNRDWNRVLYELKETLRLNPGHATAAGYLKKIRSGR